MPSKAFQECLIDVYNGEVAGEAAFESMLRGAADPQQQYVIATLWQFETEGKVIIRPLLLRLGLSMFEDAEGRAGSAAAVAQLNGLPWADRFTMLRDMVKANYLPRYVELGTLVSPEEDRDAARIATFMGTHERALVQLTENVVAGHADPAAPVAALLKFPLPRPL